VSITEKDKRWMRLAKKLINLSNHPKYKMISLIVRGGRLLYFSVNTTGTSRTSKGRGRHAEANSLKNKNKGYYIDSTLYCFGETKFGNLVLSRPCSTCLGAIINRGIRKIVYQTKEGQIVEEKII